MSTQLYAFRASSEDNLLLQVGAARSLGINLPKSPSIEFQVVHASSGIVYRVLEEGYGLRNQMWNNETKFPQISYDNRTQDNDPIMETLCDEFDTLIKSQQYYLISIVG